MGPVINCPCSDDNDRPDTQSSVFLPRFMSVRLYIGNLPQNFESKELEAQLTSVGEGIRFKAVLDRETGACRGFGFANVDDEKVADAVIEQFNGKELGGEFTPCRTLGATRQQCRRRWATRTSQWPCTGLSSQSCQQGCSQ